MSTACATVWRAGHRPRRERRRIPIKALLQGHPEVSALRRRTNCLDDETPGLVPDALSLRDARWRPAHDLLDGLGRAFRCRIPISPGQRSRVSVSASFRYHAEDGAGRRGVAGGRRAGRRAHRTTARPEPRRADHGVRRRAAAPPRRHQRRARIWQHRRRGRRGSPSARSPAHCGTSIVRDGQPARTAFSFVVRHIAHYPIRTRGTFCGSLANADPASEWCLTARPSAPK